MENKKQFIIVPPMSEAVQKLNEVLQAVCEEENIEISIIEDERELSQFIGSSGQCLVAFSGAKLCAGFLQEHKNAVQRFHSKIILLTPKEIPANVLPKFMKLGLTEAILDTSPKTVLYKVKLLLRSIKSAPKQEEKDQIVKAMLDLTQGNELKKDTTESDGDENKDQNSNDSSSTKISEKKGIVLVEQSEKTTKEKKDDELPTGESTYWKSKKKIDDLTLDYGLADAKNKSKENDLNDIDSYYRGKNKKDDSDLFLEKADPNSKKNKNDSDNDELNEIYKKKKTEESSLDLTPSAIANKEKTSKEDEEEISTSNENQSNLTLEKSQEEDVKKSKLKNEEEIASKKKEINELEMLIEAAKKRQSKQNEEDPGTEQNDRRKSDKEMGLDFDEQPNLDKDKKKDEVAEEIIGQKKRNTNNLIEEAQTNEEDFSLSEEEEDIQKSHNSRKKDQLVIDSAVEDTDSNMKEESVEENEGKEDKRKKTSFLNITEEELKKRKRVTEEEEDDLDYNKQEKEKNLVEAVEEDYYNKEKEKIDYENYEKIKRKKQDELIIESATSDKTKKINNNQEDNNDNISLTKEEEGLKLIDGDKEDSQSIATEKEEEARMNVKKMKQFDLEIEKNKEKEVKYEKVDQISSYYRNKENKKSDQNWDNLIDKSNFDDLTLTKNTNKGENVINTKMVRKDAGEMTIDYRMLKEEFENISRNGSSNDEGNINGKSKGHSENELDDTGSFKVVEVNARGFEFAIEIVNLIYKKDSKAVDFYRKISEELISQYKGHPIFYTYKPTDNKHIEAYDSFAQISDTMVSLELKEWWNNTKTDETILNYYFEKNMSTWLCRDIPSKSGNGAHWEDIELPSWASNELGDKKVELVFPYLDGLDRMGLAVLIFPDGLRAKDEKSILVTLELARIILLDSIQRKVSPTDEKNNPDQNSDKKNIASMFSGIFGRKKAS